MDSAPGRGCKDALRRVDQLLKAGYQHVVDADSKGYFDSIPHDQLVTRLQTKIADGRVLSLIESFLQARHFGRVGRVEADRRRATRRGAQSAAK